MTSTSPNSRPSLFHPSSYVAVEPFTRQAEHGNTVLGWPAADVFIELPNDAVELLDLLASGQTVEEAQATYQQRYGDIPDLIDLLEQLEVEGLVKAAEQPSPYVTTAEPKVQSAVYLPLQLCRFLWGPTMLTLYGLLIGGAALAALLTPAAVPGWRSLYFKENMTLMNLALMGYGLVMTTVHELAHATAARALGVPCRFSLGRRLWVWVAQTDMTGIWSVSRQKRYLPLLAGMLIDLLSASLLLYVLVSDARGLWTLSNTVRIVIRALAFSYMLSLLPQLYFFIRSDLYYVMSTAFRCKNLMGDTEAYLRNVLARWRGMPPVVDQQHIPIHELRVIRSYSVVWLLGRIVAIGVLVGVNLPLLWTYGRTILGTLRRGYSGQPYAFVDALGTLLLLIIPQVLGVIAWSRNLSTEGKAYDAR